MTINYFNIYLALECLMFQFRQSRNEIYENYTLDLMDEVWKELTDEERQIINGR